MSSTNKTSNMPRSGNVETYNYDINDFDFFENRFSDVTLIDASGEIHVRAHLLILTARSRYFSSMFNGFFKEAKSKVVKFENIDGKTLQMVISFMYTNTIELEGDTVENVITAAHLLQIKPLEVICCDYLKKQVETYNVLGVFLFAEQYNITTLSEYASDFAFDHFMELSQYEKFFLLDVHQLSKLISSDNIRVVSEKDVFHSMLAWVQHDREHREQVFDELFQHLRFTLLPPEFIASTIEPTITSSKCKVLISNAYQFHLPKLQQQHEIQRRILTDVFVTISGWENLEPNLRVGLYSFALKEWSYREYPRPLEQRIDFGFTTLNDQFYIAGGLLGNAKPSNSVNCLDLKTLQWTRLPPMLTERYSCVMTTLNGQLYVVGGYNQKYLSSVEKCDPLIGAWEYITPMSTVNRCPIVGNKGSSLCVFRNDRGERILDIYDPLTNAWTYGWPRAPLDLFGMATLFINRVDHFFMFADKEINVYNLENKSIEIIPINCARNYSNLQFALFNDSFIIGERNGFRKYCLVENKWESMPNFDSGTSIYIVLVSRGR